MIRSGDHLLWDAALVKGRALEDLSAYGDVARAVQTAFRAITVNLAQATASMRRFAVAYDAACRRATEPACPQDAPTKEAM